MPGSYSSSEANLGVTYRFIHFHSEFLTETVVPPQRSRSKSAGDSEDPLE